jgi:hypothetical protein
MATLYVRVLSGPGPRKVHSPDCSKVASWAKPPPSAKRQWELRPTGTVTGQPCRVCGGSPGPFSSGRDASSGRVETRLGSTASSRRPSASRGLLATVGSALLPSGTSWVRRSLPGWDSAKRLVAPAFMRCGGRRSPAWLTPVVRTNSLHPLVRDGSTNADRRFRPVRQSTPSRGGDVAERAPGPEGSG